MLRIYVIKRDGLFLGKLSLITTKLMTQKAIKMWFYKDNFVAEKQKLIFKLEGREWV